MIKYSHTDVARRRFSIHILMWQKKIQYSHTDVTEEGPEVDSSRRQIKDDRNCTKDKYYKKKI